MPSPSLASFLFLSISRVDSWLSDSIPSHLARSPSIHSNCQPDSQLHRLVRSVVWTSQNRIPHLSYSFSTILFVRWMCVIMCGYSFFYFFCIAQFLYLFYLKSSQTHRDRELHSFAPQNAGNCWGPEPGERNSSQVSCMELSCVSPSPGHGKLE